MTMVLAFNAALKRSSAEKSSEDAARLGEHFENSELAKLREKQGESKYYPMYLAPDHVVTH